eukprot:NODE_99_length_3687_cov_6.870506.p1 GENE.NODE_99_length_3687_cov_6.870506~~NODE_99_length_3687_cov_6.870506.p1  ORF type:complete len:642 (+),score=140.39 NODE_99_length_3687_cov_6.870506:142-2067(+)
MVMVAPAPPPMPIGGTPVTAGAIANAGNFMPPDAGVPHCQQQQLWQDWAPPGSAETGLLPYAPQEGELPEHLGVMFSFRTQPCLDFQNGYCSLVRARGKVSACFCFHFESQRRRSPVDAISGRLAYWDTPCQNAGADASSFCSIGIACPFAHGQEEISYHPAKYKTRMCNGRSCRGEGICCFAHGEGELRSWAPERFSYWSLVACNAPRAPLGPGGNREEWRRPGAHTARAPSPSVRHKQRFCASFPDVSQCRRGAACAFAHSRDEARTPLLSLEQEQQLPAALTEEFFMHRFKTLWCPIGVQHDWQTCAYAHNYQDARRRVSTGYGPRPCPFWAKKDPNVEYSQRCPLGLRCPYSHGAKEQLYHPLYFRTVICRDLRAKCCPRQHLCAFFHRRSERRRPPTDTTNYNQPLSESALPVDWVSDFLVPPFRDTAPAPSTVPFNQVSAILEAGDTTADEAAECTDGGDDGPAIAAIELPAIPVPPRSPHMAAEAPMMHQPEEGQARFNSKVAETPRLQQPNDVAVRFNLTMKEAATMRSRSDAAAVGSERPHAASARKAVALSGSPCFIESSLGPFIPFPGFIAAAGMAPVSCSWNLPESEPWVVTSASLATMFAGGSAANSQHQAGGDSRCRFAAKTACKTA